VGRLACGTAGPTASGSVTDGEVTAAARGARDGKVHSRQPRSRPEKPHSCTGECAVTSRQVDRTSLLTLPECGIRRRDRRVRNRAWGGRGARASALWLLWWPARDAGPAPGPLRNRRPSRLHGLAAPMRWWLRLSKQWWVVMRENQLVRLLFGRSRARLASRWPVGVPAVWRTPPAGGCQRPFHDTADVTTEAGARTVQRAADVDFGKDGRFIGHAQKASRGCTDPTTPPVSNVGTLQP